MLGLLGGLDMATGMFGNLLNFYGHGINNDPNFNTSFGAANFRSDANISQYFKDYDANINKSLMDYDYNINKSLAQQNQEYNVSNMLLQYELNKQLSSTAYQRAVQDMKKAGINPASLAGTSGMSAASSPSTGLASSSASRVGLPGSSGAYHSSNQSFFDSYHMSSMTDSLFNSMMSNSSQARKAALNELKDNAQHAHKLEEKQEDLAQARLDEYIKKWNQYKKS